MDNFTAYQQLKYGIACALAEQATPTKDYHKDLANFYYFHLEKVCKDRHKVQLYMISDLLSAAMYTKTLVDNKGNAINSISVAAYKLMQSNNTDPQVFTISQEKSISTYLHGNTQPDIRAYDLVPLYPYGIMTQLDAGVDVNPVTGKIAHAYLDRVTKLLGFIPIKQVAKRHAADFTYSAENRKSSDMDAAMLKDLEKNFTNKRE